MATMPCPKCAESIPADSSFCPMCGGTVRAGTEKPVVAGGNRWERQPGDFAARIESSDLNALLSKGLAVQEGTTGLLFQDGKFVGQLDPGRHTAETVTDRLKSLVRASPFSAVLVDSGDVPLSFSGQDGLTRDGQTVEFRVDITIQLASPSNLYVNFMKGQSRVSTVELHTRLRPLLDQAVRTVIGQCDASELDVPHLELQQRIQDDARSAVDGVLESLGLGLERIELIQFENAARDEARIQESRQKQQLEQEKRRQAFEEKKSELEQDWKRFREKLESEETRARMDRLESQQEFEQLQASLEHEAKVKGLVRRESWESLWKDYEERKEDRELARRHLLETLDWERRTELLRLEHDFKLLSLRNEQELDDAERTIRIQQEDEDFRRQLDREYTALQENLKRVELERGARINAEDEDFDRGLTKDKRAREQARVQQEADDEQKARKRQRQIDTYGAIKGVKLDVKEREQSIEHSRLDAEAQRDQAARDAEHERQMKLSEAEAEQRIAELKQFNEMSCEALIAAGPADRVSMLVELKKNEGLKDLSEEQILAMAAQHSPDVAAAIAEKFRSRSGKNETTREREAELYERMLQEQKASTGQLQAANAQNMEMLKELMANAFGTQRDVGVAAATSQRASAVPSATPPVEAANPAAQVVCSRCGSLNKTGARYCQHCGETF